MTGIVSDIAGIALKPIMEYELGVANVQVSSFVCNILCKPAQTEQHKLSQAPAQVPGGEETALVDSWHFDRQGASQILSALRS